MMTGPDGGIGRRAGLKHLWSQGRAGSTPALGTGNRFRVILRRFFYGYIQYNIHYFGPTA